MSRVLRVAAVLATVAALFAWWAGHQARSIGTSGASVEATTPAAARSTAPFPDDLPPEVATTLRAIRRGGPFAYPRDGVTFQNRERRLPERAPGYYREYTVQTPGSPDRGARRIVTGGDPPVVFYYTDDHYRTFRRVEPPG